jgi:hypothetical protein
VTVAGSQKGLMLPPGMSFNAISEKTLDGSTSAGLPRSYWDWQPILAANRNVLLTVGALVGRGWSWGSCRWCLGWSSCES